MPKIIKLLPGELSHDEELVDEAVATINTLRRHGALFRLEDTRAKRQLARRAADEGWKSAQVSAAVREVAPATTGARPKHHVELFVSKLERAGKPLGDAESVAAMVGADATPSQLASWAARLEHQALLLEGFARRMRRRFWTEGDGSIVP